MTWQERFAESLIREDLRNLRRHWGIGNNCGQIVEMAEREGLTVSDSAREWLSSILTFRVGKDGMYHYLTGTCGDLWDGTCGEYHTADIPEDVKEVITQLMGR